MERIELTDDDVARIESLEDVEAGTLIDVSSPTSASPSRRTSSRSATTPRSPSDLNVSEAVVRKRVSRGLAALRHRMGADHDR